MKNSTSLIASNTEVKGGYALWLVHDFFTQSSFSIGNDAKTVKAWMFSNYSDLKEGKIVRIGLMNSSGYLGSCWLEVK